MSGGGGVQYSRRVFLLDQTSFRLSKACLVTGKYDTTEFQQFVGIARRIWLQRNEVVRGGIFSHPNTVVKQALSADGDFQTALAGTLRDCAPTGSSASSK